MEAPFETLEPRDVETKLVNVVIDTPRGSRNKFKYDEKLRCFKLSRILPAGLSFPYDFGSIPRTRGADGDALDVLVIIEEPTFPGCLLQVKLIGVIGARQIEKGKSIRNDRLVGVPQTPVNKPRITRLTQLGAELDEIEHFFVAYNEIQGRTLKPTGRLGADKAQALLNRAIGEYDRSKKS